MSGRALVNTHDQRINALLSCERPLHTLVSDNLTWHVFIKLILLVILLITVWKIMLTGVFFHCMFDGSIFYTCNFLC